MKKTSSFRRSGQTPYRVLPEPRSAACHSGRALLPAAFVAASLLATPFLPLATPVHATDFQWNNTETGGGQWGDAANWTPAGGPPTSADYVTIDNGAAWVNGVPSVSNYLYVGVASVGELHLAGGGTLTVAGDIYAGGNEDFYYSSPTADNSYGTITVSGAGSALNSGGDIYVGFYGTGTLALTNGGTATAAYGLYLSVAPDSSGTATVDGLGSLLKADILYVGQYGPGNLSLTGGGKATAVGIYIAPISDSDCIAYSGSSCNGTVLVDSAPNLARPISKK